jgi:hypothetical protein
VRDILKTTNTNTTAFCFGDRTIIIFRWFVLFGRFVTDPFHILILRATFFFERDSLHTLHAPFLNEWNIGKKQEKGWYEQE